MPVGRKRRPDEPSPFRGGQIIFAVGPNGTVVKPDQPATSEAEAEPSDFELREQAKLMKATDKALANLRTELRSKDKP
ncbi:MAG: hypothetical protein ACEB74_04855 [Desulfovibrio aminophilus]|uniref:hypothetical protein n=1 Tax=Desulfovibrio aminophilus TaxID=81425 RepID=UPI0039E90AEC